MDNERFHSERYKAYLTYNPSPYITSRFFDEEFRKRYVVELDGKIYNENSMPESLKKEIELMGGKVTKLDKILKLAGKDFYETILKDGTNVKIPIIVHRRHEKGKISEVIIRITDNDMETLMKNKVDVIRTDLARFGYKEKLCIWDRMEERKIK